MHQWVGNGLTQSIRSRTWIPEESDMRAVSVCDYRCTPFLISSYPCISVSSIVAIELRHVYPIHRCKKIQRMTDEAHSVQ